jgi:hypothetical protein
MAAAETAERGAAPAAGTWYGQAFGVPVAADAPIEIVTETGRPGAGRADTSWRHVHGQGGDDCAPVSASTRLVDFRFPDGSPMMAIDAMDGGAFRIAAPGYGAHRLSSDGMRIDSTLPARPGWRWQRLLAAQVLPLTAALRGLEPLHASAVAVGGVAIAFTAASGTGKTSTAVHLTARGASLLSDDVLALEMAEGETLAHPGVRLLSVSRHELESLGAARPLLGDVLGEDDKVYLRPRLAAAPVRLGALYRLERRPAGSGFRIAESVPVKPAELLGATFLGYLRTARRLERQLEIAAHVARTVRVFTVSLPADVGASRSAELIERHVSEEVSSPGA